jgi:hypothetical protein
VKNPEKRRVVSFMDNRIHDVRIILKYMDVGGEITVDAKTIERFLRLSHAMVYAQVQGRTFRKALVRLWDTDHRHCTRRHLLVGVSRATAGIYVDIA